MHCVICKHQFCVPLKSLEMLDTSTCPMHTHRERERAFGLFLNWLGVHHHAISINESFKRHIIICKTRTSAHTRTRTHSFQRPVYVTARAQAKWICRLQFIQFIWNCIHIFRMKNTHNTLIRSFVRWLNSFALQLVCKNVHFYWIRCGAMCTRAFFFSLLHTRAQSVCN